MPSIREPNRPFGDSDQDSDQDNDYTPTYNQSWPYVNPVLQGRFERKFIAAGDTINFDSLPKLPFWAEWFGVSDAFRVLSVLGRIQSHSAIALRPLTGTEANAIGEHSSRSIRYFAWTQPVSCAIALGITVSKRGTFSFPFYRPKMKAFDPFSFPAKRFYFLKGVAAASVWHVVRFAAYLPFAWIPTTIVFNSVAESTFTAHVRTDPRLSSLLQESRQHFRNFQQQKLRLRAGVPNPAGTVPPRNPQQTGDGAYADGPTPQNYEGTDYAAQTSSAFERSGAAPEASQATQPTWAPSTSARPAPHKAQENALPDSTSWHGDDDSGLFDNDDASPVAPSARSQDVEQGQPRSPWDRIRQQAKSGSPNWERGDSSGQEQGWAQLRQDKTQSSRDHTPKTDSYSYSTEDEEKERRDYGREKAQKDFDAQLEAERRGEAGRGWRK